MRTRSTGYNSPNNSGNRNSQSNYSGNRRNNHYNNENNNYRDARSSSYDDDEYQNDYDDEYQDGFTTSMNRNQFHDDAYYNDGQFENRYDNDDDDNRFSEQRNRHWDDDDNTYNQGRNTSWDDDDAMYSQRTTRNRQDDHIGWRDGREWQEGRNTQNSRNWHQGNRGNNFESIGRQSTRGNSSYGLGSTYGERNERRLGRNQRDYEHTTETRNYRNSGAQGTSSWRNSRTPSHSDSGFSTMSRDQRQGISRHGHQAFGRARRGFGSNNY